MFNEPQYEVVIGAARRAAVVGEYHNLTLLRAVDETVDGLRDLDGVIDEITSLFSEALAGIEDGEVINKTLNEERLCGSLEKAESSNLEFISELERRLKSAIDSPVLNDDHESDVVSAFECSIHKLKCLHDVMVALRWAVMEHNADVETEPKKEFSSVEDLIADLDSD